MEHIHHDPQSLNILKNELKLQINQRLFEQGVVSREVYEQAKVKLVSATYPQKTPGQIGTLIRFGLGFYNIESKMGTAQNVL